MSLLTTLLIGMTIGALLLAPIVCMLMIRARLGTLQRRIRRGKYLTSQDKDTWTFAHACGIFGASILGLPLMLIALTLDFESVSVIDGNYSMVASLTVVAVGYLYGMFIWKYLRRRYSTEFQQLSAEIETWESERRNK